MPELPPEAGDWVLNVLRQLFRGGEELAPGASPETAQLFRRATAPLPGTGATQSFAQSPDIEDVINQAWEQGNRKSPFGLINHLSELAQERLPSGEFAPDQGDNWQPLVDDYRKNLPWLGPPIGSTPAAAGNWTSNVERAMDRPGLPFQYGMENQLKRSYEAIHGPGSYTNDLGSADVGDVIPSQKYPPLNYASMEQGIGKAEANLRDLDITGPPNIPYHKWTVAPTDALAQHFEVTPKELHDAWQRTNGPLDPEIAQQFIDRNLPLPKKLGYVSYGDMEVPGRSALPDRWKYTGNDRWARVGSPAPLPKSLARMDDTQLDRAFNSAWGKTPRGFRPSVMLPEQFNNPKFFKKYGVTYGGFFPGEGTGVAGARSNTFRVARGPAKGTWSYRKDIDRWLRWPD